MPTKRKKTANRNLGWRIQRFSSSLLSTWTALGLLPSDVQSQHRLKHTGTISSITTSLSRKVFWGDALLIWELLKAKEELPTGKNKDETEELQGYAMVGRDPEDPTTRSYSYSLLQAGCLPSRAPSP